MSKLLNFDGTPIDPADIPTNPDGSPMKRFEVKMRKHPNGELEKAVFIDGEKLDWSIDISSFREACRMGMQYKLAVQGDIAKHFTHSVGEVLGRFVSIAEIKSAIQTGWI